MSHEKNSEMSFAAVCMSQHAALRRKALRLCRFPDVSDDLVADTITTAVRVRDKFEGTNLGAWLYGIMKNLWLSRREKVMRDKEATGLEEQYEVPKTHSAPAQYLHVLSREAHALMMQRLDEPVRGIVEKLAGGASLQEIAAETGFTADQISDVLYRARKQMGFVNESLNEREA